MHRTILMAAVAVVVGARPGLAQQASQHGVVSQTVNQTIVTLEYDRPVARGRELFGELIEWDAIWTPGANRATWIDFSQPVKLEGHDLPAGRYAIWMVPKESEPWEVVVVSEWDTHHAIFPFEAVVFRTDVMPETSSHLETLGFYFPVVGPYEAMLSLHWGTTVIPLRIEVGQ